MLGRNPQALYSLTILLAPLLISLVSTHDVAAASLPIDCHKARGSADREVCGSPEFQAMDREITALYDRGLTQFSGDERHRLAQGQQSFIRQRSGCDWASHHSAHPGVAIEECVRNVMETRVRSLRQVVDRGRF